jgi:SAM-dependent methyltransferase
MRISRVVFSRLYEAERVILKLKDGMRLLDLRCGSGAAAYYLASRRDISCVRDQFIRAADISGGNFAKLGGRGQVIVTDFDSLDLPVDFDAIYALRSIGYTKNLDAWLALLADAQAGGSLLIRSPGSLDHCRREEDYLSVTPSSTTGATICRRQSSRLQDAPIELQPVRYRRLPFWAGASRGISFNTGAVEVSAKDAHIRGIGTDHLAHFKGICLQPVQHCVGYQTQGILLPADSCILRSIRWRCRD